MPTAAPAAIPKVYRTEDPLCSFVRRVLPAGQLFEMRHVFHDTAVILAFRGSAWRSTQAGKSYDETPGSAVIRDAGQVFSTRTLYCDERTGSECHEIHIAAPVIDELLNDRRSGPARRIDFSRPVLDDDDIHRRVIHVQSVFENRECALMRTTCLALLLDDIARCSLGDRGDCADGTGRRPARRHRVVIDYMRAHFDREITLQELAEVARVNQFVLLRQFREDHGITPHQYLRTFRVNQAMACIGQGMKLADVALQCGFFDQSHLNRQFKQTVGVSPGKYFSRVIE